MSHTIFSLLKILSLSHKPLCMEVQLKVQTFQQKTASVRAIHTTKTVWQMSHSSGQFHIYMRKILYPGCFSQTACTPGKVIRHMTSNFDVCEIDLDIPMSLLNAMPCANHTGLARVNSPKLEHPTLRRGWTNVEAFKKFTCTKHNHSSQISGKWNSQ